MPILPKILCFLIILGVVSVGLKEMRFPEFDLPWLWVLSPWIAAAVVALVIIVIVIAANLAPDVP